MKYDGCCESCGHDYDLHDEDVGCHADGCGCVGYAPKRSTTKSESMLIVRLRIPHKEQRYPTPSDWEFAASDHLIVTVSRLPDPRHELLLALHEQIEAELCQLANIDQDDVTAFDIAYEESRRLGLRRAACGCLIEEEPGNDVHAPYYDQHEAATECERRLAQALGVDWESYEKAILAL